MHVSNCAGGIQSEEHRRHHPDQRCIWEGVEDSAALRLCLPAQDVRRAHLDQQVAVALIWGPRQGSSPGVGRVAGGVPGHNERCDGEREDACPKNKGW